jgi:hypothetical protein
MRVVRFVTERSLSREVLATTSLGLLLSAVVAGSGLRRRFPVPASDWNPTAIKATFDGALIDDNHHLLLYYVLNNTTDRDYRLSDGSNVTMMMKLRGQPRSLREVSAADLKVFYPISVLSRQRQIVVVKYLRRAYDFRTQLKFHATAKEEQAFQEKLKAFVRGQSPDLGGFVLFDKASGYRIDLPCDF